MHKKTAIIPPIMCLICLLFLAGGCDSTAKSPPKSQAVTQKVPVQKKKIIPPAKTTVAKVQTDQPVMQNTPTAPDTPTAPGLAPGMASRKVAENRYQDKIDPFVPLFEEKPVIAVATEAAKISKPQKRKPRTPLEKLELDQLELKAIIRSSSGNKALVEEASGKGYIIRKGTFIGTHSGSVVEILKDRVVIEEEVENVLGKVTIRKKELKLMKPPGEK